MLVMDIGAIEYKLEKCGGILLNGVGCGIGKFLAFLIGGKILPYIFKKGSGNENERRCFCVCF